MRHFLVFTILLSTSLSAAPATPQASESREVIVATRRDHQVVVFDARSLSELGHFIVGGGAENVGASPDGRSLYLQQPPPATL